MSTTLCWYCQRAYGSCEWSEKGEIVPGWDAVRNDLAYVNRPYAYGLESYIVLSCPKFELDPRFAEDYRGYSKNKTVESIKKKLAMREAMKRANRKKAVPR